MNRRKIFGIGLNKTGTSTLGECAQLLGFKTTSCSFELTRELVVKKDFTGIFERVEEYDFFEDWPWPLIYKEFDERYPGSKFILTTRKSSEVWVESLKKHSMKTNPFQHCRKLVYGRSYPHFYVDEFINFYESHNNQVREYFNDRPSDFLEVCWENGDGLSEICDFLNIESTDFEKTPHVNKNSDNPINIMNYTLNSSFCLLSYIFTKRLINNFRCDN